MPRRRTPNHLKIVRNTAQPVRMRPEELAFAPITGDIQPPDWLEVHAMKEWKRIVPILQRKRVLSEADLSALAMMCMLHGKIVKASIGGVEVHAADTAQLRLYLSEFGLTPAARTRVAAQSGNGEETKPDNPFSRNRRPTPA